MTIYERYDSVWYMDAGTIPLPIYGLAIALAAACALFALALSCRRAKLRLGTAQAMFALALPGALIVSRLLFTLFFTLSNGMPAHAIPRLWDGGYSMMGALLGAALATALIAKPLKERPARLLDMLAPALFAFVAVARFGEGFTALGISKPLPEAVDSFLILKGDYDAYLRVYLIEGFVALVLFAYTWCYGAKERREGAVFLRAATLFCGAQVFLESLRFDGHMRMGFIGIQQVICALALYAIIAVFAARSRRRALKIIAFAAIPVSFAALLALEFALDRAAMSAYPLYALYVLILCALVALGVALARQERATHG